MQLSPRLKSIDDRDDLCAIVGLGAHCQRPGSFTATPDGTSLTHEEPDAGILLVRACGGRGGNRLAYPAISCRQRRRSTTAENDSVLPRRRVRGHGECWG